MTSHSTDITDIKCDDDGKYVSNQRCQQHPQAMGVFARSHAKEYAFQNLLARFHTVHRAGSVTDWNGVKMKKRTRVSRVLTQMVSCASIPSVTCIRLLKCLCVQSFEDIEAAFGRCAITYLTRKRRASAASFSVVVTTKPFESVT